MVMTPAPADTAKSDAGHGGCAKDRIGKVALAAGAPVREAPRHIARRPARPPRPDL